MPEDAAAVFDTVTLSVLQEGLAAAADEMFAVLKKTAMSPIIYEVLDVGTGITDGDGRLVSSGAGIPTFVGMIDKAVTRIIELHGETICDGDMFITNDPYYGGVTHLSDVVVAVPVFHGGARVGWAASIAHWNDVGGATPGSMWTGAREIWQEGLRLPAVRLFAGGRELTPVIDIIAANSRQPDVTRGDLWAQIAAGRRAALRMTGLIDRYGLGAWDAALADTFATGEARARAGLAGLTRGKWSIEEEQDDGARWRATVEIGADHFTVDLRDNPAQRQAPYNTSRDGAVISAQMIFKALADNGRFANAGSFTPLRVLTREGTIFHATEPAPHGYYFETRIRLFDMLWRCLAEAMPDRLPAGHFSTIGGLVLAGIHPETGRRYTMVEPQMGGWGATATRDGLDAMYSASHGETFNTPVEIVEARYGLTVVRRGLSEAPGGAGLHRGGRGLSTRLAIRAPATMSAGFSRNRLPVWGSAGGGPGGTNGATVLRKGAPPEHISFASGIALAPGDEVEISTAGGGGWGPEKA